MDDSQLQTLINGLQGLSERLALEGRYIDGALASGAVQAVRALRTRLEPTAPAGPRLEMVPPEAQAEGV